MDKIKERFIKKTGNKLENGCIEWKACVLGNGYGRFQVGGKCKLAHRVAYGLFKGKIPEGQNVLHKCDNRKCVNVDHLFLGTAKDNAVDRKEKNRGFKPNGLNNPNIKLSLQEVKKIQKLLEKGEKLREELKEHYTHKAIAKKFNVNRVTVLVIATKKHWSNF